MAEAMQTYETGQHPALPPPRTEVGVLGWLKNNLFSSPLNTVLTFGALYLIYLVVFPAIQWAIIDADWLGSTRDDCSREGACWVFARVWFRQIMTGRYPVEELWRVYLAGVLLFAGVAWVVWPRLPWKNWVSVFLLFVYPIIALYLLVGLSKLNVEAWPYRLMGFAALVLGIAALLPLFGTLRRFSGIVSIVLLVLAPIWGLSAAATWTSGMVREAPDATVVLAIVFGIVPGVALVAGLMLGPWRALILRWFWQLSVLAAGLALIGYMLPLIFWAEVGFPTPPAALAVTLAMLALAAICPWGYGESAGLPGLLARLLLPVYLVMVYLVMSGPPDALSFNILDWSPNTEPFFHGVKSVIPVVETPLWGGLLVTVIIGVVGIVASLPLGIVLALGRRSDMPTIRAICVAFIELWRGVPLITVLFMASVMLPLFLPEGVTFDKLLRVIIGVALFSAAYMAEVVRAGLQAIPRGQYEAAQALGLSYWKMMGLVVMPQALKMVIPGIVNTFIGLFKDTTLVLIVGLFDLLGMVQLANTNPNWLGFAVEGYVFAAAGFWIFCFSMSRYSQHLERQLETGLSRA